MNPVICCKCKINEETRPTDWYVMRLLSSEEDHRGTYITKTKKYSLVEKITSYVCYNCFGKYVFSRLIPFIVLLILSVVISFLFLKQQHYIEYTNGEYLDNMLFKYQDTLSPDAIFEKFENTSFSDYSGVLLPLLILYGIVLLYYVLSVSLSKAKDFLFNRLNFNSVINSFLSIYLLFFVVGHLILVSLLVKDSFETLTTTQANEIEACFYIAALIAFYYLLSIFSFLMNRKKIYHSDQAFLAEFAITYDRDQVKERYPNASFKYLNAKEFGKLDQSYS